MIQADAIQCSRSSVKIKVTVSTIVCEEGVRNAAQENVINAHGDFVYSMLWLIKPKNITTISTVQVIIW